MAHQRSRAYERRSRSRRARAALARSALVAGLPAYAVDVSVVARCDAETSPERGYDHHASRHSAGQPIVAGWAYCWVAQLGGERSSWTAPLDAARLLPGERPEASRCGNSVRSRRHGVPFRCAVEATWGAPDLLHAEQDAARGHVEVRCWRGLHGRPARGPGKGAGRGRGPAQPPVYGWVVRVVLERTPGQARPPSPLWLWYAGPAPPDPALLWRAYVHRYDLEHTLRFCRERLGWDRARVRTPEQMDTWTWVVLAAHAHLRLARGLVEDRRLPWEARRPPGQLTPLRVLRGFAALLPALGTPASPPKPCGRSPGRPKGRRSAPAPRFPGVKAADARAA